MPHVHVPLRRRHARRTVQGDCPVNMLAIDGFDDQVERGVVPFCDSAFMIEP
jgi:hypothetical protein